MHVFVGTKIIFYNYWRKCLDLCSDAADLADLAAHHYYITAINTDGSYEMGENSFTHTFASAGPFKVGWVTCRLHNTHIVSLRKSWITLWCLFMFVRLFEHLVALFNEPPKPKACSGSRSWKFCEELILTVDAQNYRTWNQGFFDIGPSALAIEYPATLLRCYAATLLRCYAAMQYQLALRMVPECQEKRKVWLVWNDQVALQQNYYSNFSHSWTISVGIKQAIVLLALYHWTYIAIFLICEKN